MNHKIKAPWAMAKTNKDLICINTWSGYGSTRLAPKGVQHLTSHNVSDSELGSMLLDALAHSRFVLPPGIIEISGFILRPLTMLICTMMIG